MKNLEQEADITLEHSSEAEKGIQDKLNHYYHDQEQITLRLAELEEEWDIERALQIEGAALTIAGTILGLTINKKWFTLSLAASVVLLNAIAKNWNTPYHY